MSSVRRIGTVINSLLTNIRGLKGSKAIDSLSNISALAGKVTDKNKITALIKRRSRHNTLLALNRDSLVVPLSWAATTNNQPYANLGDALSPVMVSALSGLPIVHQNFASWTSRLACVGTIGHGLKNGVIHFWGTGIDNEKNPIDPSLNYYVKPPDTQFCVHALRGPFSARVFRDQGIHVPDIYGDPIWFLPSIIEPATEKLYELGIVVHISELTELTDTAGVKAEHVRYKIPESLSSSVRIITTLTQPNFNGLEERVKEITACKRIISTSLHGLVIAETYGIPCVYFGPQGKGTAFPQLSDETERVDRRMRDFYSGVSIEKLFIYGQRRVEETDWEDVIQAIDKHWTPLEWSPQAFLETFPLPLAFNPLEGKVLSDRGLFERIRF